MSAEHLSAVLEAIEQAGVPVAAGTLTQYLHVLKHHGPGALLRLAARLPQEVAQQDGIREHLSYFKKREAMMQYPQFRQLGWPIGSGMVESANKVVVQARLKGAGMHWQRANVNAMLALRNAVCNERWSQCWRAANEHRSCQRSVRRSQRAQQRRQATRGVEEMVPKPPPAPTPQPALRSRYLLHLLPPRCRGPLALLPIIPGRRSLPVVQRLLQKSRAHPLENERSL